MSVVLDASALLAMLQRESGAQCVAERLPGAVLSSVNWSEVVQKCVARRITIDGLEEGLGAAGMTVAPFTSRQAEIAGALWYRTQPHGLSLADRACLAVALERDALVLTCDRAWADVALDLEIEVIR